MTQEYIALELDVDYGDGSGERTVRFEWMPAEDGKGSVSDDIRTGYLVEGLGSTALSLISRLTGGSNTQSVTIAGGNQHALTFEGQTPGDTTKPGGGNYQWGSSSNTGSTNYHTATGGSKEQQQFVLINAIRHAAVDSVAPARLECFEYSSSGLARDDQLDVYLESPSTDIINDQPGRADFTVTCVETVDLDQSIDKGLKQP